VAPALPAPGTVAPGVPNPAGLTSQFPAGLPSPLPNPAGLPSPTVPNVSAPGTAPGSPPIDAGVAPQTNVMGAGAYGGGSAARPTAGVVAGPYTAVQIAQSFIAADFNRDGELSRAEAQRLAIAPFSFEEMDRNHDGVLTRFEYEDAVR
jgi:hypothetical protein